MANRWAVLGLVWLLGSGLAQRIGVIGDWGFDSPHRGLVAEAMRATHSQKPLELILTLGDNFYPRGKPIPAYLEALPRVPIFPTFGNHDMGELEAQFALFGVTQSYYSLRRGALEIFVLYSEGFDLRQLRWLEEALAASTARWKVVSLHRPLYSSGLYGGSRSLRSVLEPLFRRYGVSLVLAGHDHDYERLQVGPITYLVSGGGGATLRGFWWVKAQSQSRHSQPNYLILEASPEALQVSALNEQNVVLDTTQIK